MLVAVHPVATALWAGLAGGASAGFLARDALGLRQPLVALAWIIGACPRAAAARSPARALPGRARPGRRRARLARAPRVARPRCPRGRRSPLRRPLHLPRAPRPGVKGTRGMRIRARPACSPALRRALGALVRLAALSGLALSTAAWRFLSASCARSSGTVTAVTALSRARTAPATPPSFASSPPDLVYEPGERQLPVDWRRLPPHVACAGARPTSPTSTSTAPTPASRGHRLHADPPARAGQDLRPVLALLPGLERAPGQARDDDLGRGLGVCRGPRARAARRRPTRDSPRRLGGLRRPPRSRRPGWVRASSHRHWQGCKEHRCRNRWTALTGWIRVSRGSHAGHIPLRPSCGATPRGLHPRQRRSRGAAAARPRSPPLPAPHG